MRSLSFNTQESLPRSLANRWMSGDSVDMSGLLRVFQQFWRENADIRVDKYDYREAAPHLIMMAFLQRVVNGGAHIDREFALGRGRLDLCVMLGPRRYPVELKLRRGSRVEEKGVTQLGEYMDVCGAEKGWLVVFDREEGKSWDERIFWRTVASGARTIHIVGA